MWMSLPIMQQNVYTQLTTVQLRKYFREFGKPFYAPLIHYIRFISSIMF